MALDIIKRKINSKEYKSQDEFEADFMLIVQNAKEYNVEGSDIYNEVEQLEEYFFKLLGKAPAETNATSTTSMDFALEIPPEVKQLEHIEVKGATYKPGLLKNIHPQNHHQNPMHHHQHNHNRVDGTKADVFALGSSFLPFIIILIYLSY